LLAEGLAAAGLLGQAVDAAERATDDAQLITDPGRRTEALTRVTEALIKAGQIGFATRVAAAICATGIWTAGLKPLIALAPSAAGMLSELLG
jgi:hypothetical protein